MGEPSKRPRRMPDACDWTSGSHLSSVKQVQASFPLIGAIRLGRPLATQPSSGCPDAMLRCHPDSRVGCGAVGRQQQRKGAQGELLNHRGVLAGFAGEARGPRLLPMNCGFSGAGAGGFKDKPATVYQRCASAAGVPSARWLACTPHFLQAKDRVIELPYHQMDPKEEGEE